MSEARSLTPRTFPTLGVGDLGSQVLNVETDDASFLREMVNNLGEGFRKVWYDLAAGVAEFMSPSGPHEDAIFDVRELVQAFGYAIGIDVVVRGAITIASADGSASGTPDESFLVGERATRYKQVRDTLGRRAARREIEEQPPDLVVEVEHTTYSPYKAGFYRDRGVRELWDLSTEQSRRGGESTITLLHTPGEPVVVPASELLPGVRSDRLVAATDMLYTISGDGYEEFKRLHLSGAAVARQLLDVARRSQEVRHSDDGPGSP